MVNGRIHFYNDAGSASSDKLRTCVWSRLPAVVYTCQKDSLEIFCVDYYFEQPLGKDSLRPCLTGRGNHSAMLLFSTQNMTYYTTNQKVIDTPSHVMFFFFFFIFVSIYIVDSHWRNQNYDSHHFVTVSPWLIKIDSFCYAAACTEIIKCSCWLRPPLYARFPHRNVWLPEKTSIQSQMLIGRTTITSAGVKLSQVNDDTVSTSSSTFSFGICQWLMQVSIKLICCCCLSIGK